MWTGRIPSMATRERPSFPWPFGGRAMAPAPVRPLTPADVVALPLPWGSRFTPASLAAHLEQPDGAGWLAPGGEYLVVEPWRRREDIAAVMEIQGRKARPALLAAATAALREAGRRVLVLPDGEWSGHARIYGEQGFVRLERVVYFQLTGLAGAPGARGPLPPLDLAPLTALTLPAILAVDHAAFPWLWWNSEAEFRAYADTPGVQVWLGRAAGMPVAYAGFTTLDRWGHLDRLAVDPAWHGRGYGAAMLAYVLGRMAVLDIHRVTLSTQETNYQSQRLYRGFGFRQTTEAYDIYGKWLTQG